MIYKACQLLVSIHVIRLQDESIAPKWCLIWWNKLLSIHVLIDVVPVYRLYLLKIVITTQADWSENLSDCLSPWQCFTLPRCFQEIEEHDSMRFIIEFNNVKIFCSLSVLIAELLCNNISCNLGNGSFDMVYKVYQNIIHFNHAYLAYDFLDWSYISRIKQRWYVKFMFIGSHNFMFAKFVQIQSAVNL